MAGKPKAVFPSTMRLGMDTEVVYEQLAAAFMPPVDTTQRGWLPDLLRRLGPWALKVLMGQIRLCPDDLKPLDGNKCPFCGGVWTSSQKKSACE